MCFFLYNSPHKFILGSNDVFFRLALKLADTFKRADVETPLKNPQQKEIDAGHFNIFAQI